MAVEGLNRAVRAVSHAWSGSLVTRSVLATLGMALLVVVLVVTAMVNRVTTGLLSDKQERSLTEATADWQQALELLSAADAGPATALGCSDLGGCSISIRRRPHRDLRAR